MSLASLLTRDEMIALSVKLLERSAAAMRDGIEHARRKRDLHLRLERIKERAAALRDET